MDIEQFPLFEILVPVELLKDKARERAGERDELSTERGPTAQPPPPRGRGVSPVWRIWVTVCDRCRPGSVRSSHATRGLFGESHLYSGVELLQLAVVGKVRLCVSVRF